MAGLAVPLGGCAVGKCGVVLHMCVCSIYKNSMVIHPNKIKEIAFIDSNLFYEIYSDRDVKFLPFKDPKLTFLIKEQVVVQPEPEPAPAPESKPPAASPPAPEETDLTWEDKEDKLDAENIQPDPQKPNTTDKKYQYKEGESISDAQSGSLG